MSGTVTEVFAAVGALTCLAAAGIGGAKLLNIFLDTARRNIAANIRNERIAYMQNERTNNQSALRL